MIAGLPWSSWLLLVLAVVPGLWLVTRARRRFYRRRRQNGTEGRSGHGG